MTLSSGVDLPGTNGNYLSVSDSADLDITGDISLMLDVALDDWTPASSSQAFGKNASAGQRSITMSLASSSQSGKPSMSLSEDGTSFAPAVFPDDHHGTTDGAFVCVGWTWRASDGRVQFWEAPTGTTTHPGGVGWTQVGTDKSIAIASIFSSTSDVAICATNAGAAAANGVLKRARIWASIDGTDERLDVNLVGVTVAGTRTPATVTDAAKGATVTINGSAWDWTTS